MPNCTQICQRRGVLLYLIMALGGTTPTSLGHYPPLVRAMRSAYDTHLCAQRAGRVFTL